MVRAVSSFKSVGKVKKNTLLRDSFIIVTSALVVAMVLKLFVFQVFYIPSGSMENTLIRNDKVIATPLIPKYHPLVRGDVIIFKDPGGWITESHTADDSFLIKRLIGLSGDIVSCCDDTGRMQVNGVSINEPYLKPGVNPSDMTFSVKVPNGYVWVQGDNRSNSSDSRYHTDQPGGGAVPESLIFGKALIVISPFEHFKKLDNYPKTFAAITWTE